MDDNGLSISYNLDLLYFFTLEAQCTSALIKLLSVFGGGRILFGLEDPPLILLLDRTRLGLNTLWYYCIYIVVWTRLMQVCVE